ncbi:MAG: M48 family metallopeptidase [Elusimicrobiota bacterium]
MPRSSGLVLMSLLLCAVVLAAKRAAPSRESLLPLLRTGQEHGRQVERLAAKGLRLGPDQERRLGRRIADRFEAMAGPDPEIERLGRRLERTGLAKRFAGRYVYRVAPGASCAFAAPGGFIFVTRGLLVELEGDRDRIAFVLAHEIGHAELGHTADRVRYKAWLKRWGVPGGGLAQGLRELAALAYSPGQELEADAFALGMLRAADFRLAASVEALERIHPDGRSEGGWRRLPPELLAEALGDYFRTHPGRRERLERLRAACIAAGAGLQDEKRFFTGG